MPTVSIPGPTFKRLAERAASLNITVEELVTPVLDQLAANGLACQPPAPLPSDDWQAQFDAWMRAVHTRADRYPPGFELDDSRESIYEGRGA